MSLLDKLRKVGSIEATTVAESAFFNERDLIPIDIPALNIALAGSLDGGLGPGLQMIAGESKTFKTAMGLKMMSAYMKKYPDSVCLYYDSEFGSTPEYLKAFDIPIDRVLHIPLLHIEQLKFDIVKKLEEIKKKDKVIIFIDSVGNLASKKEVEDALEEKSAADMTRAKMLKGLWRIVTPHLTLKDIPCIAINHIYMEQGMYPKAIMGGGTGGMYSANAVWIISKAQEKEGTDLVGFKFTINIEKSRYVVEKSKIPITVNFEKGIDKYSGILDLALESGLVQKPSNGWYSLVDDDGVLADKKVRAADTGNDDFLGKVLSNPKFNEFIKNKYRLTYSQQAAKNAQVDSDTEDDME